MYRAFVSIVAAVVSLLASPAWSEEFEVKSRIDAVTVFPNGAEVTRFGSINVGQGQHTIVMRDLPSNTISESVRVEVTATGQLVIGSVDTRRVFVTSDEAAQADERRKQLEDERDRLKDQRDEMDARIQAAETQRTLIANLATLPQQPATAAGDRPSTDWREVLSIIGSGSSEAQRSKSEALVQLRDLNRRITDNQKELAQLAPKQAQRTEVKIFVDASASLEGDLTVRYQVPNASWNPFYDARLSTGSNAVAPKIDFVRRASISQRSGESWEKVAITLSTTRPTAGASAPILTPMTVDYRPVPQPAPVAESRGGLMDMMQERDEAASKNRRKFRGVQKQAMAPTSVAAKPAAARVVSAPFQALYQVPGRLDVPDTGDPKRVLIGQETAEPTLAVRTVPKVDAKAYLYAKFAVPEGSPVLPGRVSLFRDGTFVGSGQLPVLAPREDHELGFGSDDLVRVHYNVVQDKRGETGLISTSKTENRSYQLDIKNLHDRPVDVTVLDQIPMSGNEDIKVALTGDAAPSRKDVDDKKGVLAWDFKLSSGQVRKFKFGYKVSWPSERSIIYRP